MKKPIFLAPLVVSLALAACEFATSAVAPSIMGGGVGGQPIAIVPLDAAQLGQPSGSPVGARVAQLQSDLARLQQAGVRQVQRAIQLQADMDASVASYQIAVGTLKSSQPAGTAANSVGQWQHAQGQLRTVSATLDQMSGLSNDVAKNVAFGAFLLQSIREANAAPNAVAEDLRQLGLLENSANQTSVSLDRLLEGLRQQVLSQSHFLGVEGAKLAQIAPPSVGAITSAPLPPQPTASGHVAAPAGAGLASGRPFVVIRFDNPGVEYEQQLYEAVSAALARAPDVGFDLVAAAPGGETAEEAVSNAEAARESMERVRSSLLNMGLPGDRVSISQLTDPNIQGNEVRLYVR